MSDGITDSQQELLTKLASITEQIEGYNATLFMLERERMQLRTQLLLTRWRPPAPHAEGET